MEEQNYRLQITVRRQGKPVFTSREFRTENYDNTRQLTQAMEEFYKEEIEYDLKQIEDGGE